MKLKLLAGLLLFSISLLGFAEKSPVLILKTDGNITLSQEKLITNAFLYLNTFWGDKGKSLSRSVTEKFFTPDTTLIINGKSVYKGYDQFDSHFKAVSKNIIGKIQFPLLEAMRANDKLIVHFNEDIYDLNGNSYPAQVIAIFTLQNGKIQQWEEVAYTNYFCQPQAKNIVFYK